jgi:hypothetical protein
MLHGTMPGATAVIPHLQRLTVPVIDKTRENALVVGRLAFRLSL